MEIPFHHWEMWLHFRNRSARRILPSPCDKHLHNKHLYHPYSPWNDGGYVNRRPSLTNFTKTVSVPPPAPSCMSPFRSDTILPSRAAPSVILDEGYRLSRTGQSFFRPIRTFLSGLVDSSAFQDVSSGREVSIIFTSNGPLLCRWESNNEQPTARYIAGRKSQQIPEKTQWAQPRLVCE